MKRRPRLDRIGRDTGNDISEYKREPQKQSSYMRRRNAIKEYLIDYTANSNLHGLQYIGDKKCTFVEKMFWLIMFISCVVLSADQIKKTWMKWNDSPVIVTFAEKETPVWQIPFPAVTVCFETKVMQTKFNFTEYYHLYNNTYDNLTETERHLFEDISNVCDDHLAPEGGRKFSSGQDIVNNIKEVSPDMTDIFISCKWKGKFNGNCSDLFSPIMTEEGQCYTFNMLGAAELFRVNNLHEEYPYLEHNKTALSWSLEAGYGNTESIETYPHRGLGYGIKSGLIILLKAFKIDMDYLCKGPVQGFKIILHNPAELPRLSQHFFLSPLLQDVVVAVKPRVMTTTKGLKSYDPTRRLCFFPTERYLRYFKVYTQANCEMECLSNFTYTRCQCVHFGMLRGPNMTVCNSGSMACIIQSQMELVTVEILVQSGLNSMSSNDSVDDSLKQARNVSSECQCLPACTSIEYEAETSQADYDWKAIYKAYRKNITEEMADLTMSRVKIFFKEAQFITSRRSELYGQTDFLANCGGLLGLFMGFSFLSVVEILYFLTLRLCCKYWCRCRWNKNRKLELNLKKDQTCEDKRCV